MNPAVPPTPAIASRLPAVGTTIFTVMSALAQQHGAVNLGQGFPDFDGDPALIDAVAVAMRAGLNQYPPMPGVPALREAIAAKIETLYGHRFDAASEITVTAGATQAILTIVLAVVQPGDEVIVLDPCYDSYEPNILLAGGVPVHVPLTPRTFAPDFERIAAALTPRTRAIIVNTPHNPSATIWSAAHMQRLSELLHGTDILVIADEVYEHMVYDGAEHQSVARWPGARAAQLHRLELRQDVPRDRLEGRLRGGAGRVDGRVSARCTSSTSFTSTRRCSTAWRGTWPSPRITSGCRRSTSASATCSAPAWSKRGSSRWRAREASSSASTTRPSATCPKRRSAAGSPPRSASRRFRSRRSTRAAFEQRIARFCFAKKDETLALALERLASL